MYMTPDKIYIPNKPVVISAAYSSRTADNEVEYIRKGALLEIIETARESAIVQRNFNNCPAEQEARIDAYDYIKHKLESL